MYRQYKSLLSIFSVVAVSCLSIPDAYANSNMTISPAAGHTLPTTIYPGQTVSAYYKVFNKTNSTRSGYQLIGLPTFVRQNTSGTGNCSNPVTVAANKSCTLQLDINQPVQSSFSLCRGTNCTATTVPLNVVSTSTPPPPPPPVIIPLRVAVGTYQNDSLGRAPLAYTSTDSGVTWTVNTENLPLPSDSATGSDALATLFDVTCDKATKLHCIAVGRYQDSSLNQIPLIYVSINGGNSWSLSTLTFPSDFLLGRNRATRLSAVSCDSVALHCTAVGAYNNTSRSITPLVYTSTNGGSSWTPNTTSLPLPADVESRDAAANLFGVVCANSGMACSAVGTYANDNSGTAGLAYTSTDGGNSWTLRSFPVPSDATIPLSIRVARVTCDAASELHCMSVGDYNVSSGTIPLVYSSTNGGVTWTFNASALPLPTLTPPVMATLLSVSCDKSGLKCNAVGSYQISANFARSKFVPLSYTSTNGGSSWTLGSTLPIGANNSNIITSVVCDSETSLLCSTVGASTNSISSDGTLPIAYKSSNGGITWNLIPLALPTDAATTATGEVTLYSVK